MSITSNTYRRPRGAVKDALRINLYVEREVDELLRDYAERHGANKSDVVSQLVKLLKQDEDILPDVWPAKTQPALEGLDGAMTNAA